jgi:hypothetical protein
MPTVLLTFFLLLIGSNPCGAWLDKPTHPDSPQSDGVLLNSFFRQAEVSLDPLLERVDATGEPALRVFLRLRIAAYLATNPAGSRKSAGEVAAAALADLRTHEKEIPDLYVNLFRRELLAQFRAHAPDAGEGRGEGAKPERRNDFEVAYSVLGQDGGEDKAVAMVRRDIADGKNPGPVIVFFLHRLEQVKPAEVPKVLDTLIAAEESRPGFIAADSMFTLKHMYIREQTSQGLQRRYLSALVKRAGEAELSGDSVVDIYTILNSALPAVEKQAPDLYDSASARLSQLAGRMPSGTLERLSVDKRVNQSADQLAQLLVEANAAKDESLREDMLTRAAHLALDRGQARTAMELVLKLQAKTREARLWRDQFMERAVERSLGKADVETARYGAEQIQAAGGRSSALQKIAIHLQTSGDPAGARDTLNAALTSIGATEDGSDKAVALLELAGSYAKVDSQRVPELVNAAVKAINRAPAVVRKAGDSRDARNGDVEAMMKIAYTLIPAFQALGTSDRYVALNLADDIKQQELRLAAEFAAQTGQPASGGNRLGVASR